MSQANNAAGGHAPEPLSSGSSGELRSDRLRVAHLYQAGGMDLRRPQAAQLHIYHTMHGLHRAGHDLAFLGIEGKRVLFLEGGSFSKLLSGGSFSKLLSGGSFSKLLSNGSSGELLSNGSSGELLSNGNNATLAETAYGKLGLTGTRPFSLFESGVRRLQQTVRAPYFAIFDSLHMFDGALQNLKGYDLLHERFNLLSLGGVLASKRLGIPLVLEVNADLLAQRRLRGNPERGLRRVYAEWATRVSFRAAARVICVSADLAHHLQRHWQVDAERLVVLPCAADTEAFGPNGNAVDGSSNELLSNVYRHLGLDQAPVVMWVGGFYEWHALDLLVAAFAAVHDRFPQAKLVLVGDGDTRPRIARDVERLGLSDAVIMTGAVPYASIPDLVSVADIAVAPAPAITAGEGGTGTPLKLFEYMAAGKPVVATAVEQAQAVIEHEQTGLLVEPDNVAAFARAIEHLLAHPEKRRLLGENARRRAVERHSWQQYTRKLEAVYYDLLPQRGGRGRA